LSDNLQTPVHLATTMGLFDDPLPTGKRKRIITKKLSSKDNAGDIIIDSHWKEQEVGCFFRGLHGELKKSFVWLRFLRQP
jgi:hypothetical protein